MALTIEEQKKRILDAETAMRTLGEKIDNFQGSVSKFEEQVKEFSQTQSNFVQISQEFQKSLENMAEFSNQYSEIISNIKSIQAQIESVQQDQRGLLQSVNDLSILKMQMSQIGQSVTQIHEKLGQQPDMSGYLTQNDKKLKIIHENVVELSDTTNKLVYIVIVLFVIGTLCAFFFAYF